MGRAAYCPVGKNSDRLKSGAGVSLVLFGGSDVVGREMKAGLAREDEVRGGGTLQSGS